MNAGRPKGSGKGLQPRTPFPIEERMSAFWSMVRKGKDDECWNWKGKVDCQTGYPKFSWNSKTTSAHRFAWFCTNGEIPPRLLVCHKCDNRRCQNPNHLFLGTIGDNNRDMWSKGRGRIVHRSSITADIVRQIRRMWIPRQVTMKMIAEHFGIKYKTVEAAIRKWKHIPYEVNYVE